jgi:hypothetical protein
LPGRNRLQEWITIGKPLLSVGAPPPDYVLLDHPELQETKDRVQSITDIYEKQVIYGVAITYLTSINTEKGCMGLTMDIFLEHMV